MGIDDESLAKAKALETERREAADARRKAAEAKETVRIGPAPKAAPGSTGPLGPPKAKVLPIETPETPEDGAVPDGVEAPAEGVP